MSSISRRRNGLMALSVIGGLLSWVRLKAPQSQDRTPASGYSTCCHQLPRERFSPMPITSTLPPNYSPITITSSDYPELVSNDAPVKTVEVGTVLVAYNWPTNSERYQRVNHFVQTFFAHIEDFQ